MAESAKKLLIDLGLGLAIAVACAFAFDLFHASSASDLFRILSDSFFIAAAIMLAVGGLTWTKNGGVWDGIGFTYKTAMLRIKKQYDEERITFAEYREEREKKNTSPKSALISGAVYLVVALAFFAAYNMVL